MAREREHHFPWILRDVSSTYQNFPACHRRASWQLVSNQGCKLLFPVPSRFMSENKTPGSKHRSSITQTQFGTQPPEDREQDHVRWEFQRVERSAMPMTRKGRLSP